MTEGPWTPDGTGPDPRRHAPATLRNRDAIADIFAVALPRTGMVLEVASGSGEHIVDFAGRFSGLDWQPSDPDPAALASIIAWSMEAGLPNLRPPLMLDAAASQWPIDQAAALVCINMVHISPWAATLGLMRGAVHILPRDGLLYLYGPYVRNGVETAPGNIAFNASLQARNPAWGLRSVEDVIAAANAQGLMFERLVEMPANNLSLLFRRR